MNVLENINQRSSLLCNVVFFYQQTNDIMSSDCHKKSIYIERDREREIDFVSKFERHPLQKKFQEEHLVIFLFTT